LAFLAETAQFLHRWPGAPLIWVKTSIRSLDSCVISAK
jgi:hypothetical protein